jgi:hypothetical protein
LGIESPHQSLGRSLSAKKNISHGDFWLVRGRSNLPGQWKSTSTLQNNSYHVLFIMENR